MKHIHQVKKSGSFLCFDKLIPNMTTLNSLTEIPSDWQSIRILSANVGNLSLACRGPYNHKLCQKNVEENIANNIQALQPDIVFLQELLHPAQCDDWIELDKSKVCYDKDNQSEPNQARRLLGRSYTIFCASRMRPEIGHPVGMECIGVQTKTGMIEGCQLGELCYSSEGMDSPKADCNPEFVIMSTIAKVQNLTIRLINAHPHSRERKCRDASLEQLFESIHEAPESKTNVIIAGDFNFDPFRSANSTPDIWGKNVGKLGSSKPFYYHSGPAEHNPPYPTAHFVFQKKTVDHIISNFGAGICTTLGEAPGTSRLDGGQGMDHNALVCDLWIRPQ